MEVYMNIFFFFFVIWREIIGFLEWVYVVKNKGKNLEYYVGVKLGFVCLEIFWLLMMLYFLLI